MDTFHGLFGVLVTPFDEAGRVDEPSLDRLVDFYLERGAHGLVVLSVMGEGPLLLEAERLQVAQRVIERVQGRLPVVAGINTPDTLAAAESGQRLADLGATALLLSPSCEAARNPDAALDHYGTVALHTRLPIVVLDYPPLYGKMPVPFLQRLTEAVKEVCAIKMEDRPTPRKVTALRAALGSRLRIFGGLGGLYCLQELQHGSDGFMTGYAFPEHLLTIYEAFRRGDDAAAARAYARWLPLLVTEGQPEIGIAMRKEILRQRGVIATATVRPPTATLGPESHAEVTRVLARMGQ